MTNTQPNAPFLDLSETEFEARYESVTKPEGGYFEYEEIKDADPKYVWSVVEGDEQYKCEDGEYRANLYALPGLHRVNLIGFIKTVRPWEHENINAVYFDVLD